MAEKQIVKVRYFSETSDELSAREYTYFSEDILKVDDVVLVPVRDTFAKAKVSAVGLPESEIAAFVDRIKTIPAGVLERDAEDAKQITSKPEEQPQSSLLNIPSHALVRIHLDEEQAFIALREQVSGLLHYAEARIILGNDDVKEATQDLALMSGVKKAVEELRVEFVGPLNDYVKAINATFKLLSEPLNQADQTTRAKILAYRAEQERKRLEAEEINRQKIELARREAALKEGEVTVDTTPVPVPDAAPAHVRTDVGSLGTAKVWKFEVAYFSLLPDEYKLPDLVKIGKVIRAGVAIPGIKAWQEDTIRITR